MAETEQIPSIVPTRIETKRRRPWLAGILAIPCPGLGQFYNAQIRKGLWIAGLYWFAHIFAIALSWQQPRLTTLVVAALVFVVAIGIQLIGFADAIFQAWRNRSATLTNFNKVWVYCVAVVFAVLASLALGSSTGWRAYSMPSESMLPTLYFGDYVMASKGYYHSHAPEIGDLVVFELPRDRSIDYVKRVVGLPGDRVQMRDGDLYINGKKAERRRVEDFFRRDKYGNVQRIAQYLETLPNGVEHSVLALAPQSDFNNMHEFIVPDGHYFVLGENRDNSTDSRMSEQQNGVGYVPRENIRDRLFLIYWSANPHRIGTSVE